MLLTQPTNLNEVHELLDILRRYRRLISNFEFLIVPFVLMILDNTFEWNEFANDSFVKINEALSDILDHI